MSNDKFQSWPIFLNNVKFCSPPQKDCSIWKCKLTGPSLDIGDTSTVFWGNKIHDIIYLWKKNKKKVSTPPLSAPARDSISTKIWTKCLEFDIFKQVGVIQPDVKGDARTFLSHREYPSSGAPDLETGKERTWPRN